MGEEARMFHGRLVLFLWFWLTIFIRSHDLLLKKGNKPFRIGAIIFVFDQSLVRLDRA